MKVKITVEVGNENSGLPISQIEVDKVMRAVINGVMEKYRGRIDNVQDSYGEILYGVMTKSKMMMIADEEKKVEA
jgi:hypothetical protein